MTTPEPALAVTCDTVLGGRLALVQPAAGHRVGHDAILLAAFAPARARTMVDLGAGVGGAGLAFLVRCPQARGTLVELDPALAALAAGNAARNGLADRCRVVAADVLDLGRPAGAPEPVAGAADLVLTNPPFNLDAHHRASPDPGRARAHAAPADLLRGWVTAAYRCLAPAGTLCLIHRPADLALILAALEGRFGAIELMPVHPVPGAPAVRLLVRAAKGRRTAPAVLPGLVLADAGGRPSAQAQDVLRGGAGLDAG